MTPDTLRVLILRAYMARGEDSSVKELAEFGKVNERQIRKALEAAHGLPSGCTCRREGRTSYSKDFPTMESGHHMVTVYGPTREALAALVKLAIKAPGLAASDAGLPAEAVDKKGEA